MADDRSLTSLLLETYEYVWHRLRNRLDGLRDAEYLWEPCPTAGDVEPAM